MIHGGSMMGERQVKTVGVNSILVGDVSLVAEGVY